MYKNYKIRAPYFEIGPKCFMWGERMLKLAQAVDKVAYVRFASIYRGFKDIEEFVAEIRQMGSRKA